MTGYNANMLVQKLRGDTGKGAHVIRHARYKACSDMACFERILHKIGEKNKCDLFDFMGRVTYSMVDESRTRVYPYSLFGQIQ